ncbi:MAG: hypothetical protein JO079_12905, partial [Frankiaceae bacterium]|nr:hypothetical protein [Frankiaceae bacterium]
MRRLVPLALAGLTAAALVAPVSGANATTVPLPNSMASTGDSITRAYDATSNGCFLADCPQYSWSTGTTTATTV